MKINLTSHTHLGRAWEEPFARKMLLSDTSVGAEVMRQKLFNHMRVSLELHYINICQRWGLVRKWRRHQLHYVLTKKVFNEVTLMGV